jgi:hypothetical protein
MLVVLLNETLNRTIHLHVSQDFGHGVMCALQRLPSAAGDVAMALAGCLSALAVDGHLELKLDDGGCPRALLMLDGYGERQEVELPVGVALLTAARLGLTIDCADEAFEAKPGTAGVPAVFAAALEAVHLDPGKGA